MPRHLESAKSESLSQLQLRLLEEAWEADTAEIEAQIEQLPAPENEPPRIVHRHIRPQ